MSLLASVKFAIKVSVVQTGNIAGSLDSSRLKYTFLYVIYVQITKPCQWDLQVKQVTGTHRIQG